MHRGHIPYEHGKEAKTRLSRQARFLSARGNTAVLQAVVTTLVIGAVFVRGRSADASQIPRVVQSCPTTDNTPDNTLHPNPNDKDVATLKDLVVNGLCQVYEGTYNFHNVNIINNGQLIFYETPNQNKGNIDFYVKSILVENGGSLTAGVDNASGSFGAKGGVLTFHFFGQAPNSVDTTKTGTACRSPVSDAFPACGIPKEIWNSNKLGTNNPTTCTAAKNVVGWGKNLPGDVDDCFYQ